RKDFQEVPPRVEYSVTRFGISLMEALRPLCEWGGRHKRRIEAMKDQVGVAAGPIAGVLKA
ncbi:MAG TPA: winged helix-turn-helix transcriptional regulator, partial [Isosphaeraceae bacterium]